jgi:hypothetical protein
MAFHKSIHRRSAIHPASGTNWEKHMTVLYTASFLIIVRSIFRVVEYLQGFDGYLLHHEAYLYIFDALLMLLVMLLFNAVHPGKVVALAKHKSATDYEFGTSPFAQHHRRLGSGMN